MAEHEKAVMRQGALVNADTLDDETVAAANKRLAEMPTLHPTTGNAVGANLPGRAQDASNEPQVQQNQQNTPVAKPPRKQRADAGKPRAAKPKDAFSDEATQKRANALMERVLRALEKVRAAKADHSFACAELQLFLDEMTCE